MFAALLLQVFRSPHYEEHTLSYSAEEKCSFNVGMNIIFSGDTKILSLLIFPLELQVQNYF